MRLVGWLLERAVDWIAAGECPAGCWCDVCVLEARGIGW